MRELKKVEEKYYIRHVLTDKGIKELKVSKEIADKQIEKMMKEDKKLLEILEKL